jgi:hypothetical protein
MNLSFQAILANVTDIDRSAEFYSEVFEFPVLSRDSEVVTLLVSREDRRQVLILRRAHSSQHPGGRAVGARMFGFEAASMEEVDLVEARLKERNAFTTRRRTEGWRQSSGLTLTGSQSRSQPTPPEARSRKRTGGALMRSSTWSANNSCSNLQPGPSPAGVKRRDHASPPIEVAGLLL